MDCPAAPSCGSPVKCNFSLLQPPLSPLYSLSWHSISLHPLASSLLICLATSPSLSRLSPTVLVWSCWPFSQIFRWSIAAPLTNSLNPRRHQEIDELSSNATGNVQTKTGSSGGDWEGEHWQMGGSFGRQKWGPWVAVGGLWIMQMRPTGADMWEYRDRCWNAIKNMSNGNPKRSVSVLTKEERRGFPPLCWECWFFFFPLLLNSDL